MSMKKHILGSLTGRRKIAEHLRKGYFGDIYAQRVIEKLDLDKKPEYGTLNHGENVPGEPEPFHVDKDFEKELIELGSIDYCWF